MAEGSNMCKPKLHRGSLRIVVEGGLGRGTPENHTSNILNPKLNSSPARVLGSRCNGIDVSHN